MCSIGAQDTAQHIIGECDDPGRHEARERWRRRQAATGGTFPFQVTEQTKEEEVKNFNRFAEALNVEEEMETSGLGVAPIALPCPYLLVAEGVHLPPEITPRQVVCRDRIVYTPPRPPRGATGSTKEVYLFRSSDDVPVRWTGVGGPRSPTFEALLSRQLPEVATMQSRGHEMIFLACRHEDDGGDCGLAPKSGTDCPIPPLRGQRGSRTKGGGKPIGLADALPRERTLSGNVDTLEAHRCGLTSIGQIGRGYPQKHKPVPTYYLAKPLPRERAW
ncbi:hypothetical protein GEV33_009186 [Tenebrio molitor]|uniref:Uncharacterized protein n=1 Tax=Tenebrio molitor TaxID=7067 RepID=A0A8J6L9U0_TENMO|nr:hypothetical protein GEV33_009186 [Tenebrio molitor]